MRRSKHYPCEEVFSDFPRPKQRPIEVRSICDGKRPNLSTVVSGGKFSAFEKQTCSKREKYILTFVITVFVSSQRT